MKFEDLPLAGAKLMVGSPAVDERGYFERIFAQEFMQAADLPVSFPQISISENVRAGTRRGLHFQRAPQDEAKIVRCVRGAIFDAIVDIRPASATFGKSCSVVLEADDHRGLFVPSGFAHGFQTLTANATVLYLISAPYEPALASGIASDDPNLAIDWPGVPVEMSQRDRELPWLADAEL
jgi:dTDP-4-dehydrorhamnose 3,5-epimerase